MTTSKVAEIQPKVGQPVRPNRIPVSGNRDILTVKDADPNYVYRWVLDENNRIERFNTGGYEVVIGEHEIGQDVVNSGSQIGSAVTKYAGGGKTLVLMRIPKDWYDEDQAAKQALVDASEVEIYENTRKSGHYGGFTAQKRN